MSRCERCFQIAQQRTKWPTQGARSSDQNIVIAGAGIKGKDCRGGSPQSPARTISLYGDADLSARREADTHMRRPERRIGGKFQGEAIARAPNSARCPKEIGSFLEFFDNQAPPGGFLTLRAAVCQAESLLRPCALRRASTFLPPAVAMRARNP
jgi:hypothetical protein